MRDLRPIAYVSANQRYSTAQFTSWVLEKGWIPWALEAGPILQAHGYKRLWHHNPGGQHWLGWHQLDDQSGGAAKSQALTRGIDTRGMWINQLQLAQWAGCKHADPEEIAAQHMMMLEQYGIEEITYYLGSPETLRDPYKEGLEYVKPFLLPKARLAFDHTFAKTGGQQEYWQGKKFEADTQVARLVKKLRKMGYPVLVEARSCVDPCPEIDGTVARQRYDNTHQEELVAAQTRGEVTRITYVGDPNIPPPAGEDQPFSEFPDYVTPLVARWATVPASEFIHAPEPLALFPMAN